MRSGAFDYVMKPFKYTQIEVLLNKAAEQRRLREENAKLNERVSIPLRPSGSLEGEPRKARSIHTRDVRQAGLSEGNARGMSEPAQKEE
jgi:DNA-binding NtrC family response regulator